MRLMHIMNLCVAALLLGCASVHAWGGGSGTCNPTAAGIAAATKQMIGRTMASNSGGAFLSSSVAVFELGQSLTVSISSPNFTFNGLMLQAQDSQGNRVNGFSSPAPSTNAQIMTIPNECSGGSSLTHLSPAAKNSVLTFTFTPPQGHTGDLFFRGFIYSSQQRVFFPLSDLTVFATAPGCTAQCAPAMAPVCGSDGQTYGSSCLLDQANCGRQSDRVSVAHTGACASATGTPAMTQAPTAGKTSMPVSSGLTAQQVTLVQETWDQVALINETASQLFYDNLFELYPEVVPLFQGVDIPVQRMRLIEALDFSVRSLTNLGQLVPVLQSLAERHVGYGVQPVQYDYVGVALLKTLEQGLGSSWNASVAEAWTAVYGIVSSTMKAADAAERISVTQATWELVKPINQTAATLFYQNLFAMYPEVVPLFNRTDLEEQKRRLIVALDLAVSGLNDLSTVVPLLQGLARRHVMYGVQPEQYDWVGAALLKTLEQGLGPHWTRAAANSWAWVYGIVSSTMKEADAAERISVVQSTWELVKPINQTAATLFYQNLFTMYPEVEPLFHRTDLEEQKRRLIVALDLAVSGLNDLSAVIPLLEGLGRRHVQYGVLPIHYDYVGAALLKTLEQGLGSAWTASAANSWEWVYDIVATTMKNAAEGVTVSPTQRPTHVVTLVATRDSFTRGSHFKTHNYGNSKALNIKNSGYNRRTDRGAWIGFNSSSISSGLISASLSVFVVKLAGVDNDLVVQGCDTNVSRACDSWSESDITYATQYSGPALTPICSIPLRASSNPVMSSVSCDLPPSFIDTLRASNADSASFFLSLRTKANTIVKLASSEAINRPGPMLNVTLYN